MQNISRVIRQNFSFPVVNLGFVGAEVGEVKNKV